MNKVLVGVVLIPNLFLWAAPVAQIDLKLDVGNEVRSCTHSLQNCSLTVSGNSTECLPSPGAITITNNSPIAAKNISAFSADPNFLSSIVQNNGCPASLFPHQSCTLSFYTNTSVAFSLTNVVVKGNNTNATYVDMNAVRCSLTVTSNGDGHETIQPSGGQTVNYGASQSFTVSANTGYRVSSVVGGSCPNGSWSGSQYTTGAITSSCSVSFSSVPTYTGVYTVTYNSRTVYSIDSGTTWNPMINPVSNFAIAVDSNNTVYLLPDEYNGSNTPIYSTDGINWSNMGALPDSSYVYVLFAFNNTMYAGTSAGYLYSTTNYGSTWTTLATPAILDGNSIESIFVTPSGAIYIGTTGAIGFSTGEGDVFYSSDNGTTWTETPNAPDSSSVYSVAVDDSGVIYVVTENTYETANFLYSNDGGQNWQSSTVNWPADSSDTITSLFVFNNTLYLGTAEGYINSLINNGDGSWSTNTVSSQPDGSPIYYFLINQSSLSPVFVETSGVIPVSSSSSSVDVSVTNLSNSTVTNMQAQLPANLTGVTQTPASNCGSVAPQGSCTLTFTSTLPYSPQNVPIVGANTSGPVSQLALVFSMTSNANTYLVYNVDSSTQTAYIVDNSDVSGTSIIWGPSLANVPGISENDTASSTSCNGATDGACNTQKIIASYGASYSQYAAGLCYQSTSGGASAGNWYLPSTCELTGGMYNNATTGTMVSCTPTVGAGVFSLYNLGLLSGLTTPGNYWSSTENSSIYGPDISHLYASYSYVWGQLFDSGDAGSWIYYSKNTTLLVRCVQALSY